MEDSAENTVAIRSITQECRRRLQECVVEEAGKFRRQAEPQAFQQYEGSALKKNTPFKHDINELRQPKKDQGKLILLRLSLDACSHFGDGSTYLRCS